ncbi:DoxX family protein [Saccharothrix sp. NRRL B-16314]|uniref:DoxX family protein n=1 Tax=Saccharothrix sp. NRRL B-16314 TaxID=1463825 RepID=UPI000526CBAE|nr:membrane protein [Saccharothrix sp. NRRL B-16314]
MAPFVVLIVVSAALLLFRKHWSIALRGGLAAMFTLTAGAHFIGMREELIAMVPPALPEPGLLVTVTGVLEFAGVVGLLWWRTAPWAAAGLSALLVVMFPANVYAAEQGISPSLGDQLLPRTLLQIVFLAATLAVVAHYVRARRADRVPTPVA